MCRIINISCDGAAAGTGLRVGQLIRSVAVCSGNVWWYLYLTEVVGGRLFDTSGRWKAGVQRVSAMLI